MSSATSWQVWEGKPALLTPILGFFPLSFVKSVYKREKPKELYFFQLDFKSPRFSWGDRRHVGGWRRVPPPRGPEVSGEMRHKEIHC